MHACLAHLSSEIQTIDYVIQAIPGSAPYNAPTLPTEILLLIREWLFPLVTAHLVQKSTTALEAYEHSLRNLLCPDCIVYNLDIYGPNIWQWEQFHGACACLETSESPPPPPPTSVDVGFGRHHPPKGLTMVTVATPNPKQFTNAQHWLETYLSREAAALLVKARGNYSPVDRVTFGHAAVITANNFDDQAVVTVDIWETVAQVLREYNCEFIREHEDSGSAASAFSAAAAAADSLFRTDVTQSSRRDFGRIIPLTVPEIGAGLPDLEVRCNWRSQAILRKAIRDLCLDCIEPFGTHNRDPSSFKRLLWRSSPSNFHDKDHVQMFFGVIASLAAGCLSLPITCTTIAVSIFYFYSRPRSFRIF